MQIKFIILFVLMSFVVPSSIDYDNIYYFANEDSEEVEEIQDQNDNVDEEIKEKKKKRRLFGLLPPKKDKNESEKIESSDEKKGKRRLFGLLPPKKEKKKKDIDEVSEESELVEESESQENLNTDLEIDNIELGAQSEVVEENEVVETDAELLDSLNESNSIGDEYSGNREILKNIISQQDVMINLISQLNYSSDSTTAELNMEIEPSPQIDSSELYSRIYQNLYMELISLVQGKFDEIDNRLSDNDNFHSEIANDVNSIGSNIEELNMGLLSRIQSLELSIIQLENVVENRISAIENSTEERLSTMEAIVGMLNNSVEKLELYDGNIDQNISSLGQNINSRLDNISGDINNMNSDISGLESINQELIIGSLKDNININKVDDTVNVENVQEQEKEEENDFSATKKLSKKEYKASYDRGYAKYLAGEYSQAIDIFNNLLDSNTESDLADNCQYWLGEIYYNRKDYKNALNAFYKVFEFQDNNKEYYAQYKIGLCYLYLDDISNAVKEFKKMVANHPSDSDLVKKSKRLIDKYSNN